MILKNDQIVDTISWKQIFDVIHITCFDNFDLKNDIFELRHGGGTDGVTIHVNLINKGDVKKLYFGSNENLDWLFIDGNLANCNENVETAQTIKMNDGSIIESGCIGQFKI